MNGAVRSVPIDLSKATPPPSMSVRAALVQVQGEVEEKLDRLPPKQTRHWREQADWLRRVRAGLSELIREAP